MSPVNSTKIKQLSFALKYPDIYQKHLKLFLNFLEFNHSSPPSQGITFQPGYLEFFEQTWNLHHLVEVECTARQTANILSRMEDLIYSIRKQRHDFNHHLQTVYGFLEVGSFREARDYIRNTFSAITTCGELLKTDNHEISAMLYTKIGLAEAKNINLEVVINCSLKNLPLKSGESNSILGNLIDNAMEAAESAPGKSA